METAEFPTLQRVTYALMLLFIILLSIALAMYWGAGFGKFALVTGLAIFFVEINRAKRAAAPEASAEQQE